MNVMIVGCGKTGACLAQMLAGEGHDVSVVDAQAQKLKRLGGNFPGYITQGNPIDQDTLRRAGIEHCEVLAAVCAEDNVNIMVGQIAKELFGVPKVLTRIYDPKREAVYSQLGLQTFCPTNLTAAAVLDILFREKTENKLRFRSHIMQFYEVKAPRQVWDCDASQVELSERYFLFAVQRSTGELIRFFGQKLRVMREDTLIIGMEAD